MYVVRLKLSPAVSKHSLSVASKIALAFYCVLMSRWTVVICCTPCLQPGSHVNELNNIIFIDRQNKLYGNGKSDDDDTYTIIKTSPQSPRGQGPSNSSLGLIGLMQVHHQASWTPYLAKMHRWILYVTLCCDSAFKKNKQIIIFGRLETSNFCIFA